MHLDEVALRTALIIGSAVTLLYGGVTVWITAPLGLAAMGATAELAVRPYATSAFDRLLLACGSVVVTLILLGLLLNFITPWGLTRITWTTTLVVISFGILVWRRGLKSDIRLRSVSVNAFSLAIAAAVLIIIAATALSLIGVRQWDRRSLLSFSLVANSSNAVVVEIQAVSTMGKYRIVTSRASDHHRYRGKAFAISAGGNGETLRIRVPIKTAGRWTIDLEPANHADVSRELIVDVGGHVRLATMHYFASLGSVSVSGLLADRRAPVTMVRQSAGVGCRHAAGLVARHYVAPGRHRDRGGGHHRARGKLLALPAQFARRRLAEFRWPRRGRFLVAR